MIISRPLRIVQVLAFVVVPSDDGACLVKLCLKFCALIRHALPPVNKTLGRRYLPVRGRRIHVDWGNGRRLTEEIGGGDDFQAHLAASYPASRMLRKSFCAKSIDLIVKKDLNEKENSVTREECRRASLGVRIPFKSFYILFYSPLIMLVEYPNTLWMNGGRQPRASKGKL
jgi:hypothetical protein